MGRSAIDIKIKGQEKLRKVAANLANAKVKQFMDTAVLQSAFRIERSIRNVTPVDTGFLQSSIRTEKIRGGAMISENSRERGGVGYGFYVHEGTSRMKAQPYFEWGLKAERSTLDDMAKRAGIKIITEIVKGV